MEKYWPEQKVYLFGRMAFAPKELEGRMLVQKALRHYIPHEDHERFEVELYEYEQAGYWKVSVLDDSKPVKYALTDVDHQRFRNELSTYLDNITLPAEQLDKLWVAAANQYKERGYAPRISWRDIYGDSSRLDCHPPFWEPYFRLALDGKIKINSFSYDATVEQVFINGNMVDMQKELVDLYTRPFVEFEIMGKKYQQRVSRPRRTVKHKASIIVTKNGRLQVVIDGKRHDIWSYKSEGSNTYRAARALYDANGESRSKTELNLKANSTTQLKGIVRNMHVTGILEELFVEYVSGGKVSLAHKVTINDEQYERLVKYVKAVSRKYL